MFPRPFWVARITDAWRHAPITWLTGPRRCGKTVLARSLPDTEFVNCDLPSAAARMADPEEFFTGLRHRTLVLDEVHQLPDPSRILKIAADEFPQLRILATGSSTLAATQKFRDSLTGRKRVVRLTPVLHQELPQFGLADLRHRLLCGGLPPALLASRRDPEFYAEWLDSYFSRDVQELFRLEKRAAFLRALSLLLVQSGGMLEVTRLAADSQVSRPTILNWLEVLETTHAIHVVRPHPAGRRAIVSQPKVYGFDTGFVCHARGWDTISESDCGPLWEHLVLDTLVAAGVPGIAYWRDKQQREVDFVVPRGHGRIDAIECKWGTDRFSPRGLLAFRSECPAGRNFVVAPSVRAPFVHRLDGLRLEFVTPQRLCERLLA